MTERQIQDGLCAYLRKNHLSFVKNRMDKKSCIREGWPDITVVHCGRAWLCELKTPTGKLSVKQKEVIAELRAGGTPVMVARSVESALGSLLTWLGVVNAAGENLEQSRGVAEKKPSIPQTALSEFQADQWEWVQRTFSGETSEDVLNHLKEELVELESSPFDPMELADVFLLVQCLASHAGVDLMAAARAKFEVCKGRKWQNIPGVGFRTAKEAPSDPERPKSDQTVRASSENLFVGRFGANDYVFEGDSRPGGSATIIRVATSADLINLRRR